MSACPKCGCTHVAGDAVALSRFAGATGYRTPDDQIHATREDAQEWLCEQRSPAVNECERHTDEARGIGSSRRCTCPIPPGVDQ